MYAHAIAQVEATDVGVHLIWAGPRSWVYSPRGWFVQRRQYEPRQSPNCETIDIQAIRRLRSEREAVLALGDVTLHDGLWLLPILSLPAPSVACDVFTLELREPSARVEVDVTAQESFAFALREGKVVATGDAPVAGAAAFDLRAIAIDTVVVYARSSGSIRFCAHAFADEALDWEEVPFVASGLQLPLKELDTRLGGAEDEYAEARKRLAAHETLDRADFERFANTLRTGVAEVGPPPPLHRVLMLRNDPARSFEELTALDPLKAVLSHPKWRRVAGLGWFDNDPALVVGETYEYRITGHFPREDVDDRVYGFHTVPTKTLLPAELYLQDLRLRLPQPTRVERTPGTPETGLTQVSRRGIALHAQSQFFWRLPSLNEWSLIVDFPSAVSEVVLELAPGHQLEYSAGLAWGAVAAPRAVPAGSRPRLRFASPITQLRLRGAAFFFAFRVPSGQEGLAPRSVVLPPVTLVDTPRPEPPLAASIENLQRARPVPQGDRPPDVLPVHRSLGFEIRWRPALRGGLSVWPADEASAPPLDAAVYQIEHRQEPSTIWEPLLPEENWTAGDRDERAPDRMVHPGVDLMDVYPEIPRRHPDAGLDMRWDDVFGFAGSAAEENGEIRRPPPEPGSRHQYRVRAVDAIGRPSLTWRDTNILRLEKRVPPPLPVGPDDALRVPELEAPEPTGVQARVLVRGAPDLAPADASVLGGDDNVIVLRWGWHTQQREQDPYAREFRIYVAKKPLDAVSGSLTQWAKVQGPDAIYYDVGLQLERAVQADAAKGLLLEAGYPFRIVKHGSGAHIQARLETRVPGPDGRLPEPKTGPILLPVRLTPDLSRPPAWSERIAVEPIAEASQYSMSIRNRLTLNASHPRDAIWVGVSAADDQPYVPDQAKAAPFRAGNESPIVPVLCEARYHGRPMFDVPPPLAPVPIVWTPEPAGRPIFFDLDLTPHLAGTGLGPSDRIRVERVSADDVFAAYYVANDNRIMARVLDRHDAGESEHEVKIQAAGASENPADRAAVIAALGGSSSRALADRFVVFLAGAHPYRDRLFEPSRPEPLAWGAFEETLPAKSGRYVYRVRKADAAGHLSEGSAIAKAVVRVPSLVPGASPERLPGAPGDPPGLIHLRLAPDAELTHLLMFSEIIGSDESGPAIGSALLRVPNRFDLSPGGAIRLRSASPASALLSPKVKSLSDSDVSMDQDGFRRVTASFTAGAGERVRVWACTLTLDRIPSALAGPFSLTMPPPPLPVPTLQLQSTLPRPAFTWSWPPGPTDDVAMERSADGKTWRRISPLFDETVSGYTDDPHRRSWRYRLKVMSADGRSASSNVVKVPGP